MTSSKKINFLQFKVIDEPWNEYKLEDGSILRIRLIMSGLMKEDGQTYAIQVSKVFNVIPNEQYVGIASPPLKESERIDDFIEAEDLKILSRTDNWNEYEVPPENLKLNVKGELVSVSRTSRHDDRGIPVYSADVQLLLKHKKKTK